MTAPTLTFPIFDAATRANPQAVYEEMRLESPIYRGIGPMTGNAFWFFTEYDDVQWALKEPRFIKDGRNRLPEPFRTRYFGGEEGAFAMINRHLLDLDPPDHTRLRNIVHKAFTPKAIQELLPRIETIADDLLQAMAHKSEADLIDDFAFPLPITVIAEMLGIGVENQAKFREWTTVLLHGASEETTQISLMEFLQFVNELIDARQEEPRNDILSGLIRAETDGSTMDRMELISMIFLLLVAGHETTVNLIGNGTLALLQYPDQMALLQQNPSLINSAVEEMLRFNGPVETPTYRFAVEDVVYKGNVIQTGDILLPSLLGANRDPNVFKNPNTFDITRNPNPHVAFGFGIHFCLGAPLARMEGTVAIQKLVAAFPKLRLNTDVSQLQWNNSLLIHGMKSLSVGLR